MNNKYICVLALVLALRTEVSSAHDISCRGGDGPVPLIDISSQLPKDYFPIRTKGSVSEFIHWPGKNALLYRSEYNELRRVNTKSGLDMFLSNLQSPLSTLVDPNEKFVLTTKANLYLDTEVATPTWGKFSSSQPVTHLFWHRPFLGRNNLFSIADSTSCSLKSQLLEVYRFTAGNVKPERCKLNTATGDVFQLGRGHQYPHIFLYTARETTAGSFLTLYRIRINSGSNSCRLEKIKAYSHPIPGEIQSVHQFEEEKSFAVITHLASVKKVFWDSHERGEMLCDFGDRDPLILDEKNPIIFGWNQDSGLTVFRPEEGVYGGILPGKTKGKLAERDLRLSHDGDRLFLNILNTSGHRQLGAYSFD